MKRQKTSVSREDYLKAIWEMLEEGQSPISARLAEELGVTPPAVTAALKRLTRDELVRVDRAGRIDAVLQPDREVVDGREVAGAVVDLRAAVLLVRVVGAEAPLLARGECGFSGIRVVARVLQAVEGVVVGVHVVEIGEGERRRVAGRDVEDDA